MPSVIPATQIWNEAYGVFGKGPVFSVPRDAKVVCPDYDWFVDEFIPKLDQVTLPYVSEAYDCEDFCAEAQVLMTRSVRPNYKTGHTLNYVELQIPPGQELHRVQGGERGQWHATNVVRFSDGRWFFFEPQPGPINRRLTQAFTIMDSVRPAVREVRL
tara:strand:- start:1164 stop:1637 length:474 start_codon:yes stop_codon:yes gene_type:complete